MSTFLAIFRIVSFFIVLINFAYVESICRERDKETRRRKEELEKSKTSNNSNR